jgi:hypothetical protein
VVLALGSYSFPEEQGLLHSSGALLLIFCLRARPRRHGGGGATI